MGRMVCSVEDVGICCVLGCGGKSASRLRFTGNVPCLTFCQILLWNKVGTRKGVVLATLPLEGCAMLCWVKEAAAERGVTLNP